MARKKTKKTKCPECKRLVAPKVSLVFNGVRRRDNGLVVECPKCGYSKKDIHVDNMPLPAQTASRL